MRALDPNFIPASGNDPQEPRRKLAPQQPQQNGQQEAFNALNAFGRDLTEMAKKGELDPVIGRQEEIERVTQILCRRTKNNPVLIGEAGVGKTAIHEGRAGNRLGKCSGDSHNKRFSR